MVLSCKLLVVAEPLLFLLLHSGVLMLRYQRAFGIHPNRMLKSSRSWGRGAAVSYGNTIGYIFYPESSSWTRAMPWSWPMTFAPPLIFPVSSDRLAPYIGWGHGGFAPKEEKQGLLRWFSRWLLG